MTAADSMAMFTSEATPLEQLPGWRKDAVRLRFRTLESTALLLYQPSVENDDSAQLLLALRNG